jgi:hypothetical protein
VGKPPPGMVAESSKAAAKRPVPRPVRGKGKGKAVEIVESGSELEGTRAEWADELVRLERKDRVLQSLIAHACKKAHL